MGGMYKQDRKNLEDSTVFHGDQNQSSGRFSYPHGLLGGGSHPIPFSKSLPQGLFPFFSMGLIEFRRLFPLWSPTFWEEVGEEVPEIYYLLLDTVPLGAPQCWWEETQHHVKMQWSAGNWGLV